MEDFNATFARLQPRLVGAAYRMLGSLAEAEDVVQDVWTRWHLADRKAIDNAEAWLVATTARRAIDRLRQSRTEREKYTGIWLPEPVLTEQVATPEQLQETSNDLSVAFLMLLERLAPEARVAFMLREVFDVDYPEIAEILGKSAAACRQIVHRAKNQVREERTRYSVSAEAQQRILRRFVDAIGRGDFAAMKSVLAESAELLGDGGGIVASFPQPLLGGQRIAQLLYAPGLDPRNALQLELAPINGQWGILRYINGALESVQSYEIDAGRIVRVFVQRNPEKLQRVAAQRVPVLR